MSDHAGTVGRMSTREQLQSQRLQSIATRWVVGDGDQADTADDVRRLLDAGDDGTARPLADALAELRSVGAGPDVATKAAARFTDVDELEPNNRWKLALLVLAGADEQQARQWRQAHPEAGWRTPQAKAHGEQ